MCLPTGLRPDHFLLTCHVPHTYLLRSFYLPPTYLLPAIDLMPTSLGTACLCLLPASYLPSTCLPHLVPTCHLAPSLLSLPLAYLSRTSYAISTFVLPTTHLPPTYLLPTSHPPPAHCRHTFSLPPAYLVHTCHLHLTYVLYNVLPTSNEPEV